MEDLEYGFDLPKVGDLVKGKIISIDDRKISVDFGSVTEGTLYLEYYTLDKNVESFKSIVKIGDEIEAVISKVSESSEGTIILLSRLDYAKKEAFNNIASDAGKEITVTVNGRVKNGYMVKYNGVLFFLHESENPNLKKGDKVKVLITNLDEDRNTGRVSIKALEKKILSEEKSKEFSALNVGDIVEGPIMKIEPFGVFIQLDKLFGLVRLKELDHVYVENPTSKYKVGDVYKAKVISLENGKINLSFKALTKSPIEEYAEAHKVSDKVTGKVVQKLPFGIVLELAPNVTGLLHQSEFSWNPHDNLQASVKIGTELEAAIVSIDVSKKKIALSIKALIDNPWSRVEASAGDIIDCKVTEVTPKGLKIEALGVDGTIPAAEITLASGSNKLSDYYNAGDNVKAIIKKVDPKSWVLVASIKKLQEQEERKEYEKFMNQDEEETPITIGDTLKK